MKNEKAKRGGKTVQEVQEKEIKVDDAGVVDTKNARREKFLKVIEAYKLRNPVKYERKKAALEKQLASIK